jgi:hypothetical protein
MQQLELQVVYGVWVLMYQGREYVRLLDAISREDAEQQVVEMMFLRIGKPNSGLAPPSN